MCHWKGKRKKIVQIKILSHQAPVARRSTRVPWPEGRHVSHGPSPRIPEPSRRKHHEKKLTEPSRPSSAHHEAQPHGEPNPEPYPITAVGVTVELDPTAKDHAAGKISVCPGPIGTRGFCRSRFAHGMFFFPFSAALTVFPFSVSFLSSSSSRWSIKNS
jgi:hypothetical protein